MTIDVERTLSNYRDTGNLKTRISIYEYRTPQIDPTDLAADLMPADPRLVLDVGCGSGRYVARVRRDHPEAVVVGIDAAPGMLTEVEPPVMVADAQAIPYPDGCADVVLAMHMLYHVADIARAVAEFRRVLKPGGTLLVATNVEGDMGAYRALVKRAFDKVLGLDAPPVDDINRSFNSANGPGYLEAEFDSVEHFENHGVVAVPGPGPLLAFIDSTRSFFGVDDAAFDRVLEAIGEELDAHFATHDSFEFNKGLVVYRCR